MLGPSDGPRGEGDIGVPKGGIPVWGGSPMPPGPPPCRQPYIGLHASIGGPPEPLQHVKVEMLKLNQTER